jgi:uncharacterized protein (TIGR03067 family)
MRTLLPLVFVLPLLGAGQGKDETKNDDAKKIQGTWKAIEFENDGKKMAPPQETKLKFGPEKIEVVGRNDPAAYKLGTDGKLRTIDVTPEKGKKTLKGLYELDGDTLRICLPMKEDDPRPKEMTSKGGHGIITFKREK